VCVVCCGVLGPLADTQVANNQLKVHDQVMLLEGSQATVQTVQALRSGAHAMKEVSRQTNIENVEQVCVCVAVCVLLPLPPLLEIRSRRRGNQHRSAYEYGSADVRPTLTLTL